MIQALALKRRRRRDPGSVPEALMLFGVLAATGFAWGWVAQGAPGVF